MVLAMLCCAQSGGADGSPPSFVGFVMGIDRGSHGAVLGTVTVESHADKLVTRHVVTITNQTEIALLDAGGERRVGLDAVREKAWVKIWFARGTPAPAPRDVVARRLLLVPRP